MTREEKELLLKDPRHPEQSKEVVPMSYGKELEDKMQDACARYFSNDDDTLSLAGVFYAGVEAQKEIGQKPVEWSEEDEKMCQETINWFEKKCFPYALEEENPAKNSIIWLKSLKKRMKVE